MKTPSKTIALGLLAAITLVPTVGPGQEPAQRSITFFDTLDPWRYPDAQLPQGGRMNDGGHVGIQSINCRTVMTTPDPFAKVLKFYCDKLGLDPATGENLKDQDGQARSVLSQDDTDGRPLKLRVLVENRLDTTTTIILSRADEEELTHIAWSRHIRIAPPK